jgi:hypothetical protein
VVTQASPAAVRGIDDIAGWFGLTDQLVMDWVLDFQERRAVGGDLLEMGAYLGKSAVLIGFHRRRGERFVVCDLFGEEPPTAENQRTARYYTDNLTREAFEANYAAFHAEPPDILQAPTSEVGEHVQPGSCRFIHIDACHLFDFVRQDMATARSVLQGDGIVVFDDIRTAHTPGVAAAVWPEVFAGELHPICITPKKLYATWGDATPIQAAMLDWLATQEGSEFEVLPVAGRRLIRIGDWSGEPLSPVPLARHAARQPRRLLGAKLRRVAADLLPPIVARALRSALHPPR